MRDKQSRLMSDLLFTVHQNGGDDVTWKPPISLLATVSDKNSWDISTQRCFFASIPSPRPPMFFIALANSPNLAHQHWEGIRNSYWRKNLCESYSTPCISQWIAYEIRNHATYLQQGHWERMRWSAHEQFCVAQKCPLFVDLRLEAFVDEHEVRPRREPVLQSRQQGRERLMKTLTFWNPGASSTTP